MGLDSEGIRDRVRQHLVAFFHVTNVHEVAPLNAIEYVKLGARGNRYAMRPFPAFAKHEVIRGKPPITIAFVVFSPTGELRTRRDDELDEGNEPNTAVTEMAMDLDPHSSAVQELIAQFIARFAKHWPSSPIEYFARVTSKELDLVYVFVEPQSLAALVAAHG